MAGAPTRLQKITPAGMVVTVAGSDVEGFAGDGGPAGAAVFNGIGDVVTTGSALLIADSGNNRIRKIDGGVITTMAGSGYFGFPATIRSRTRRDSVARRACGYAATSR